MKQVLFYKTAKIAKQQHLSGERKYLIEYLKKCSAAGDMRTAQRGQAKMSQW